MKTNRRAATKTATAVASGVLLARAQVFHELAQTHRETAAKCDNAELPPEYGDYERGKADAYDVCSDTLKHIAKRANAERSNPAPKI